MLNKPLLKGLCIAAAAGLFAVLSWALIDTGMHATGDYAFCTSCHSMAPIAEAYEQELHGGNNSSGWRAACTDCHLPHDNSIHYLIIKAKHGIVDPTMELLHAPLDIDWHGNRSRRAEFVYDSGCLGCHKNLATATEANGKAFLPHRDYFTGNTDKTCVECHQHVGHKNLGLYLEQHGWRAKP